LAGYGAFGPDAETETPVMLDQSNLPPQPPVAPAVAQQQAAPEEEVEEEVETQKPATGITKFLLGTDAKFGGDEEGQKGAIDFLRGAPADFLQNTISKLQDPEMRYALAKAAQPSEGFVPRNFLSDVAEAREEYRDMQAQRDYLQAQTRDVDTTEIEKLTDFFMSTQDVSNATPEQILSLRNDIALSLNSMSKDQAAQELAAKMIEVYGSTPTGLAAVEQIIESMQTGDSLASVLEEFALERQDQ
jgi:hypothetical protein